MVYFFKNIFIIVLKIRKSILPIGLAVMMVSVLGIIPADVFATFPGTNGKITFDRNFGGGNREVFVMNDDGSGKTQLTNDPGFDQPGSWSSDGTKNSFCQSSGWCW